MPPSTKPTLRLPQFDWMRGLACLFMFERHCYDSWLSPAVRSGTFFTWTQLIATMAAPSFLFLAGVSTVLIVKRASEGGKVSRAAGTRIFKRGTEILLLAYVFHLVDTLLWLPGISWHQAWPGLLRMDILNVIGLSLMMVGAMCWMCSTQARAAVAAGLVCAGIALATPLVWTTWRSAWPWMLWPLEVYLNGAFTGTPQPGMFPVFPWAAFTFAGFVTGYLTMSEWARNHVWMVIGLLTGGGVVVAEMSRIMDMSSIHLYPVYNYWVTSPNFFLMRVAILLVILAVCYLRCRWHESGLKHSPLIILGQHSLLVYWVHIEFVYGRFNMVPRQSLGIAAGTIGLIVVTIAMVVLAYYAGQWESKRKQKISLPPAVPATA